MKGGHREELSLLSYADEESTLVTAAKRIKKNGAEAEEEFNESVSNSSTRKNVLQNTSLPLSSHPILNIKLNPVRINMIKIFQGQKFHYEFKNLSELTFQLETWERGHGLWLTVFKVDMASDDFQEFLAKFANVIRNLDLSHGALDSMSPSDLQNLLSRLPNLTDLTFDAVPTEWKRHQKSFPSTDHSSFLLPQVETFYCGPPNTTRNFYPKLLTDLLQLMPNLKNVHRFPLGCTQILTTDSKLNLGIIKTVDISSNSVPKKELLEKLSQLATISPNIGLEMIELRFQVLSQDNSKGLWKSCSEALSRILWNNQNTLEHLMVEPLVDPQFLVYPEMKAVKKLCFVSTTNQMNSKNAKKQLRFFGDGFNVSKTFPHLVEVTLESKNLSLGNFLKFFPEDAFTKKHFRGVRSLSLKLQHSRELLALEKLAALFPDLTTFFMDINVRWLNIGLPHILWLWPKLISLKLNLDIMRTAEWTEAIEEYHLDPVFTGISAEKCRELREYKEKLDINLRIYQENFAIPSMRQLKELILIFCGNYQKTLDVVPLFSHVTLFYGFQCLPDLKVTCGVPWDNKANYKIREMLSPIKEYVIFNPNYY